MNAYYKLLDSLKQIFESDDTVSTVSANVEAEIDVNKKDVFSYVEIAVLEGGLPDTNNGLVTFSVQFTSLDIRDIIKTTEPVDKFWGKDNMHDNLNHTHAVLIRAYNKMHDYFPEVGVAITATSSISPVIYDYGDLLDGWQMTVTIAVPIDFTGIDCYNE